MAHVLPALPYDYAALEPNIDRDTMQIHHTRHHAGYVEKLNAAFDRFPELHKRKLEEVLSHLETVPEEIRTAVRNHGGGHLNHSLFWPSMTPERSGLTAGPLEQALRGAFGAVPDFKTKFVSAGLNHFGSGWVWLVLDGKGKLAITTTANQDNPVMFGQVPLLGNDLWEHAYYLKYQNRRGAYLEAWFEVVNWSEVERRFNLRTSELKQAVA